MTRPLELEIDKGRDALGRHGPDEKYRRAKSGAQGGGWQPFHALADPPAERRRREVESQGACDQHGKEWRCVLDRRAPIAKSDEIVKGKPEALSTEKYPGKADQMER